MVQISTWSMIQILWKVLYENRLYKFHENQFVRPTWINLWSNFYPCRNLHELAISLSPICYSLLDTYTRYFQIPSQLMFWGIKIHTFNNMIWWFAVIHNPFIDHHPFLPSNYSLSFKWVPVDLINMVCKNCAPCMPHDHVGLSMCTVQKFNSLRSLHLVGVWISI